MTDGGFGKRIAGPEADLELQMSTLTIAIRPSAIALFKAIVESYDNLATLRTEDPVQHHLKLYFVPEVATEIERLIDALSERFTIVRIAAS